jgi:hypothetical protein
MLRHTETSKNCRIYLASDKIKGWIAELKEKDKGGHSCGIL